jgi:hypothetical protein
MAQLWTIQDQQAIKAIDSNSLSKFNQLQNEVEVNDLQKYLGTEFYQELKRNTAAYSVLLNGGTYTYNGVSYSFSGLIYVCSYLLYAKYVRQSYITDTFSGFVAHTGEGFQRLSSAELANQEAMYKEIAGTYWDECLAYLRTLSLSYFPTSERKQFKIDSL